MKRSGPPRRRTPPERGALPPRKPVSGASSGPLVALRSRSKGLARDGGHRSQEPGAATWRRKRYGVCAACGQYGRIIWHHLLPEQVVRREATAEQLAAGAAFDPRNALPLGAPLPLGGRCDCHSAHHSAMRKLPIGLVTADAMMFAAEILGSAYALDWYKRHYQYP